MVFVYAYTVILARVIVQQPADLRNVGKVTLIGCYSSLYIAFVKYLPTSQQTFSELLFASVSKRVLGTKRGLHQDLFCDS